jgi:hypothetical protein
VQNVAHLSGSASLATLGFQHVILAHPRYFETRMEIRGMESSNIIFPAER